MHVILVCSNQICSLHTVALSCEALVPHLASILYCSNLDISDRVVEFSLVHLSPLVSLCSNLLLSFHRVAECILISVFHHENYRLIPQILVQSKRRLLTAVSNDFRSKWPKHAKAPFSNEVPSPVDRTTIASAGLVSLLHRRTDRSYLPTISVLGDLAAVFCTPKQALIFLSHIFKKKECFWSYLGSLDIKCYCYCTFNCTT